MSDKNKTSQMGLLIMELEAIRISNYLRNLDELGDSLGPFNLWWPEKQKEIEPVQTRYDNIWPTLNVSLHSAIRAKSAILFPSIRDSGPIFPKTVLAESSFHS